MNDEDVRFSKPLGTLIYPHSSSSSSTALSGLWLP